MKKSTLLFIGGNLLVLLIPILFMLGLRFKINQGDVVDSKAERDAQTKKFTLPLIENVVLKSAYKIISLEIRLDTINQLRIDTGDYKFVTHKLKDKTLFIDYDYVKDSINRKVGAIEDRTFRKVYLHLNKGFKTIKLDQGQASVYLSKATTLENDIEVVAKNSDFSIHTASQADDFYDSSGNPTRWDSIPFKIKATLLNSEFEAELRYVKKLEIKAENSIIKTYEIDFYKYDLTIDKYSTTNIEISKLRKMRINYLP